MTVISVHAVAARELRQLGHNLEAEIAQDQEEMAAWQRSLAGHHVLLEPWESHSPTLNVSNQHSGPCAGNANSSEKISHDLGHDSVRKEG